MSASRTVWLAAAVGCATPAPRVPPLTTVILGPEAATRTIRSQLGAPIDGVSLAMVQLPATVTTTETSNDHASAIARARKGYVDANFPACRAALDSIDAIAVLGSDRMTAARVLLWRVACRVGEGDRDGARRDAAIFATAGLALPADISAVTPDVEAVIGDASARAAKSATSPLHVVAKPSGARISVDGKAESCTAPCTLTLVGGAHAIAVAADGFTPQTRRIQTPADKSLAVELIEAPPPLVASQLQLRIARGAPVDDPSTLALAARAVRARQIAVFAVDERRPAYLIGALFSDGRVRARAERVWTGNAAAEVTRELLDRGGVIPAEPLWRRPRFWIAVVGATAVAAATTAYFLYEPDPRSQVVFP